MAKESIHLLGNYDSLPITAKYTEGTWIQDIDEQWYLDFLASYSANNFGHRHPDLVDAAHRQIDTSTLVSRAIMNDQLGEFADSLSDLSGKDLVLPMNSGAEAVESALKVARKWGEVAKGIPESESNIVVAKNNFHGRTISIISFSSDSTARKGFGPYTPGFKSVEFGNATALADAIDDNTAAVLIEPVQGEAGVIIPQDDYLPAVRRICTERNVKMIADEIQSGLGRTGMTFACDNWGVEPDAYILGKALSGGILPLSAVVGDAEFLDVVKKGEHGSTYGGNPLAAAVGIAAINLIRTGEFQQLARERGQQLSEHLNDLQKKDIGIVAFRSLGLWAGVDIDPQLMTGKQASLEMLKRRVIVKDTHGSTIRLSPPLNVAPKELDYGLRMLEKSLTAKH